MNKKISSKRKKCSWNVIKVSRIFYTVVFKLLKDCHFFSNENCFTWAVSTSAMLTVLSSISILFDLISKISWRQITRLDFRLRGLTNFFQNRFSKQIFQKYFNCFFSCLFWCLQSALWRAIVHAAFLYRFENKCRSHLW